MVTSLRRWPGLLTWLSRAEDETIRLGATSRENALTCVNHFQRLACYQTRHKKESPRE